MGDKNPCKKIIWKKSTAICSIIHNPSIKDHKNACRAFMLLRSRAWQSNFHFQAMVTKNIFSGHIGNNLRQIRNEKNISIEELANRSEMTYSQVSRIELGKINTTCYTLYVLSKVLEVHVTEFFRNNIEWFSYLLIFYYT